MVLGLIFVSEQGQRTHIPYEIRPLHREHLEFLHTCCGFAQSEEPRNFDLTPVCDEKTIQDRRQVELRYAFEKYIYARWMVGGFYAPKKQLAVSDGVFPKLELTIRADDQV